MNHGKDSLAELIEILKRVNPELLDIITANSEKEFDTALLPIIEKAVIHLEQNSKEFKNLSENGLTGIFKACLMGIGITVSQETNSNGHVDLIIVANYCKPVKTRLLEAKIFNYYSYHIKGLSQLLERYITGREGGGILVEYIKEKNIKDLVESLREQMDEKMPLGQIDKSNDHLIRWSFLTTHKHHSGENLSVQHIEPVNNFV